MEDAGKESSSQLLSEIGFANRTADVLVDSLTDLRMRLQCVTRDKAPETTTKEADAPDEQLIERADQVRQIRLKIGEGLSIVKDIIIRLEV